MNLKTTSQDISNNEGKLLSLQLLRCIAVVLVVNAHAIDNQINLNIGESFQQNFYFLENFGAVGVDIFFVLSGFIISLVAKKYLRLYGFRDFLIKRLIRVLPIYWIVTLITIAFSVFTSNISSLTSVNSPNRYFLKSFFILPFFDGEYFRNPIIVQGWILSFELYFYIVVAIFLISKSKYIVVTSFLFITSLVATGMVFYNNSNVIFKFISNPINLEFVFGCIIGCIYSSKIQVSRSFSLVLNLIALIGLGVTLFVGYGDIGNHDNIVNGHLSMIRLLLWGVPCSLLVASLVFLESFVSKQIPKFLILIGDASYSIYLTQYLSLKILSDVWKSLKLTYPDVFIIISVGFSVLVGTIFYFTVEKKLINYLNRQYNCFCKKRDSLLIKSS
jgi:exopolysaccharide production protein ExoZ